MDREKKPHIEVDTFNTSWQQHHIIQCTHLIISTSLQEHSGRIFKIFKIVYGFCVFSGFHQNHPRYCTANQTAYLYTPSIHQNSWAVGTPTLQFCGSSLFRNLSNYFFLSWPYRYLKEDRCRPDLNNRIWFLHLLEFNFFFLQDCGKWKMFFNSLERTWMVQDQDGKNCGSPIYCYSSNIFTSGERGNIGKRQRISVIHKNEIFPVRLRSYCS